MSWNMLYSTGGATRYGYSLLLKGSGSRRGSALAFQSSWTEDVSSESYAKLFRYLYAQPPRKERDRGGIVTPSGRFAHALDSLISHLAKAPTQLALGWFGAWKEEGRFGVHRDWFASIYAELMRAG